MTDAPDADVRDDAAPAPRLLETKVVEDAVGIALVLHGGGGRGAVPVSPTQLSVLRMVPIARRIAHAGRGRVTVLRLLNAVRGFGADPLSNVRWALGEIASGHPDVPVALVGHSLGGSVALAAAGDHRVTSVVALAPWLGGSESVDQLRGRHTLVVHGDHDRVTSDTASRAFAARARSVGAAASFVHVERGEHTMLRRMPAFDVLAARFVQATLDATRFDEARGHKLHDLARSARDEPGDYSI